MLTYHSGVRLLSQSHPLFVDIVNPGHKIQNRRLQLRSLQGAVNSYLIGHEVMLVPLLGLLYGYILLVQYINFGIGAHKAWLVDTIESLY